MDGRGSRSPRMGWSSAGAPGAETTAGMETQHRTEATHRGGSGAESGSPEHLTLIGPSRVTGPELDGRVTASPSAVIAPCRLSVVIRDAVCSPCCDS